MPDKRSSRKTGTVDRLDQALAAIIGNTRTTKRKLSLPELAAWIDVAVSLLGGVDDVAKRVGLSAKMLRQLLVVKNLAPEVQLLFSNRQLDSVDLAAHLAPLTPHEQEYVAQHAAKRDLTTYDVRAIRELKKERPQLQIDEIVTKVKESRNIRQFVLEFVIRGVKLTQKEAARKLSSFFDSGEIVSFSLDGSLATLTLSEAGRAHLRALAQKNKTSATAAVMLVLKGEV